MIVKLVQSFDSWTLPMIMLGTKWYVLFNAITRTSMITGKLKEASRAFLLRGIKWLTTFMLPGVFPSVVTGIISATGGAWNAAIVA